MENVMYEEDENKTDLITVEWFNSISLRQKLIMFILYLLYLTILTSFILILLRDNLKFVQFQLMQTSFEKDRKNVSFYLSVIVYYGIWEESFVRIYGEISLAKSRRAYFNNHADVAISIWTLCRYESFRGPIFRTACRIFMVLAGGLLLFNVSTPWLSRVYWIWNVIIALVFLGLTYALFSNITESNQHCLNRLGERFIDHRSFKIDQSVDETSYSVLKNIYIFFTAPFMVFGFFALFIDNRSL